MFPPCFPGLAGNLKRACSSTLPIIWIFVCVWRKVTLRILSDTTAAHHSQSKQCWRYLRCISEAKSQLSVLQCGIYTLYLSFFLVCFLFDISVIELYKKGGFFRSESTQEIQTSEFKKQAWLCFHFSKPTKRKSFDCITSRRRGKRGSIHNVRRHGITGLMWLSASDTLPVGHLQDQANMSVCCLTKRLKIKSTCSHSIEDYSWAEIGSQGRKDSSR